jgi:hypothetical protein
MFSYHYKNAEKGTRFWKQDPRYKAQGTSDDSDALFCSMLIAYRKQVLNTDFQLSFDKKKHRSHRLYLVPCALRLR